LAGGSACPTALSTTEELTKHELTSMAYGAVRRDILFAMDKGSKMRLTDRKDIGVGRPNGTIVYYAGCLVEEHADGSITLHGRAEDVHYPREQYTKWFLDDTQSDETR
jgi:hypothetical protein